MQDQVADRIEKKLQTLPWFEKVVTYAKPNFAAMQVTFRDNTPAAQVPSLFYQIRKKLDDVRGELPAGTVASVDDEYGDVDSLLYTLSGEGADYSRSSRWWPRVCASGLLRVEGVVKVTLYGVQDQRIFVEFSHAKLATLGIAPQVLFDALSRQNAVTPAGTVETSAQRIPLRDHRRAGRRAGSGRDPRRGRTGAACGSAISPPSPAGRSTRRTGWCVRRAALRSPSAW